MNYITHCRIKQLMTLVYFKLFDVFEASMAHAQRRRRLVDGVVIGPGKDHSAASSACSGYSAAAAAAAFLLLLAPRPEDFLQLEHLPAIQPIG